MQNAETLNEDWRQIYSLFSTGEKWDPDPLVNAMLFIGNECASALKRLPIEPLTKEEQDILENDMEDDPRFYDIHIKAEEITSFEIVSEWFDKGVAAVNAFRNDSGVGYAELADYTIDCWDGIVPEYFYHELAHMAALIAAQLVSAETRFRRRTWLFKIPAHERFALFLGLGQELDLLKSEQVQAMAKHLST